MFIRHRRSENSPSTTQNSPATFRFFPERASLFHNNSPATLHCSPATTILNENPARGLNKVRGLNRGSFSKVPAKQRGRIIQLYIIQYNTGRIL